ncbi:MAG: carbohydrate-binding domain-containing protein [Oscillospiraceae bacterium]
MNNFVLKKQLAVVAAALVIMSSASGCGKSDSTASDNSLPDSTEINSDAFSFVNTEFDAEDLEVGYDDTVAVNVELNGTSAEISGSGATENNGVITVSEAGVYVFSGELSNGRIIVDAGKDDKVRLIMNGVKISCSDNSPVFINQADKVIMTLNDNTENALVDGKTYNLSDDDSNVDGAVFFRDDLTLNGSGSLTVTANYKHGIVCKDDLIITGGKYVINSTSGGIYGKDSLRIKQGDFDITAGSNGIKATNSDESDKGYVYISDGSYKITAENDGIEAVTSLLVDGDSSWITGGTIVACGSSGMAESFGEDNSTQNSVLHNFSSTVSGGTEVQIIDSDGNVIISYTPEKNYQSVVFSSPEIRNGTYTICAGDISEEITVNSVVTSNGSGGMQGGRGNMLKGERKGNIENPENENSVVTV